MELKYIITFAELKFNLEKKFKEKFNVNDNVKYFCISLFYE